MERAAHAAANIESGGPGAIAGINFETGGSEAIEGVSQGACGQH